MNVEGRASSWTCLASLLMAIALGAVTGAHAQAVYRQNGKALLPDRKYTPGRVAIRDKGRICPHADTVERRHVTESMKMRVCQEYSVFRIDCTGAKYEIDHLVPLEIGGSNDLRNLWPQPIEQARQKDQVEWMLHNWVCTGRVSLEWAQQKIADDWYSVYLKLNETGGEK